MLQFALVIVAGFAALIFLDLIIGRAIRLLAPILPNELVGFDGWFVDTRYGTGIFDRRPK